MKGLKIVMFFVIVYFLNVFTVYFSMANYQDTVSASCLECSLIQDVFGFPIFSSILLTIIFMIFKKIITKREIILIGTLIFFYCI